MSIIKCCILFVSNHQMGKLPNKSTGVQNMQNITCNYKDAFYFNSLNVLCMYFLKYNVPQTDNIKNHVQARTSTITLYNIDIHTNLGYVDPHHYLIGKQPAKHITTDWLC